MRAWRRRIVLNLFVTAVALALIFLLDKVADLDSTGHEVDTAARSVIKAIAVLIGFSWEKAFDTAVESIAETIEALDRRMSPSLTKLALAVLLAATVIPAWRMHILPTIIEYEELEEEQEEKEAEEAEKGEGSGERGPEALTDPLLVDTYTRRSRAQSSPAAPKSLDRRRSTIGLGARALKDKVTEYREHIKELQQDNCELREQLETSRGSQEADGLQALEEARKSNGELDRRNRELEASLSGISRELSELQKLADLLTS